jgi:pimeloyl-ACP methyl ester carboxylesterase
MQQLLAKDGTRIVYEVSGQGSALVILHGITGAPDTFGPLLAAWPALWLGSAWKPQAVALPWATPHRTDVISDV